jgi:hypothetical protein
MEWKDHSTTNGSYTFTLHRFLPLDSSAITILRKQGEEDNTLLYCSMSCPICTPQEANSYRLFCGGTWILDTEV